MSNTLLTIDQITREALRIAHEKASFLGTIDRQYDESFGKSGSKIGSTLRIRHPARYTRTQGTRVINVQEAVETNTTLTLATQDHVAMTFNSAEMYTSLDDFSKRHLEPAMAVLVSGIESDVLQGCSKLVANLAGTAGTPPVDLSATGAARAKLNQNLAPKDGNRFIQMDSVTMGGLVNGLKGLFQDSTQIKEQYREGMVGRTAMADFYENERVWTMTNGSDVACTLNTYTVVDGDADLTVTSFATPTAGMVFTIAGVYDCHPETKQAYSHLKQFTVLAASTSTNLLISPTIYLTGARKNVSDSAGADVAPSTTAALVFVGAASTSYVQNLMYHKDAFTFVTGDLPLMGDAHKCVRKTYDGLSLRVWQASDITNDELVTRIDMLYGYAAPRPEWASRITS